MRFPRYGAAFEYISFEDLLKLCRETMDFHARVEECNGVFVEVARWKHFADEYDGKQGVWMRFAYFHCEGGEHLSREIRELSTPDMVSAHETAEYIAGMINAASKSRSTRIIHGMPNWKD
jgi:hypothetical protein